MDIALKSLGCAKNQVDAEYLLGGLKEKGHQIISDFTRANCIIVNTCGFIESAKQESLNEIFELLENKIKGKCEIFIVTGCLAQRYVDQLSEEIPEIDAILGVGAIKEISEILDRVELNTNVNAKKEGFFLNDATMPRHLLSRAHSVYLKIADGCDNCCTYCAIPLIRGSYRSRNIEDLVKEAQNNVKSGVKEINIIAQDTTSYGIDIYGQRKLADLIKALADVDGDFWLRVLYCYPEYIDDNLLSVIASTKKMCKYIDMPIQHVHPDVVRTMRRRMNAEQLLTLISKIRGYIPDVIIRSTFLVGFPGETAEHFKYLTNFVKKAQLDWGGVFAYSREESTPAYKLKNQVATKTKEHRQRTLTDLQNSISIQKIENFIGKTLTVLVDGKSDLHENAFEGRSMFHAPDVDGVIYFTSPTEVNEGEFVDIKITHTQGLDLIGERKA